MTLSTSPETIAVRACEAGDLERINEIYNHYVLTSPATFDIEPKAMEWRREWFEHYATAGPYRVLVAVGGSTVAGFAHSSKVRPKAGYDVSVETTIYLAPSSTGRGIGSVLYGALFAALEGQDLHRACAGIAIPNPASVALHERFGFRLVGTFREQGRKFDRYWDVSWYEKELG